MNTIFLASFEVRKSRVSTTIIDRNCVNRPTCHGTGESVQDAVANALDNRRLTFRSEVDELEANAAALRGKNLLFTLSERDQVKSLGFA